MIRYKLINKLSIIIDKLFPFINTYEAIDNEIQILQYKESLPFQEVPTQYLPKEIKSSFELYNSTKQSEYLYKFEGPGFIEPKFGWVILPGKKYLSASLPYHVYPKPSAIKLKFGIKKVTKIKRLISVRYGVGNYWHFFNDILGQIIYIQKQDIDPEIPILVPQKLLQFAYVNDFLQQSNLLKKRKWIFQEENELVECQEVYLAKNLPNTKENFAGILDLLGFGDAEVKGNERIYLKRGNKRGRRIENYIEVEALVEEFGYIIVDTDKLSFFEQISLFRKAKVVLGIHGAGLANLIFSMPGNLQLVEIFPSDLIPPHYFWLCHELGFKYDAILGGSQTRSGLFKLPIKVLRDKLTFIHGF